jgi:hypothetical protein
MEISHAQAARRTLPDLVHYEVRDNPAEAFPRLTPPTPCSTVGTPIGLPYRTGSGAGPALPGAVLQHEGADVCHRECHSRPEATQQGG